MEHLKISLIGGGVALVAIGTIVYTQFDNWFTPEPTGPGSGDVVEHDPMYDGPGSGDFAEYDNPGSDDYNAGIEHDPVYDGPGSGDFDYSTLPTGPGSGDEMPYTPEPTGPGSGDEMDENYFAEVAVGSCNAIQSSSVCTEFIGDFWKTPALVEANCDGVGTYSNNPCPRPTSGGCHVAGGTPSESVIWYYPYGGDPVDGELITYASGACNANPMGTYIYSN